MANISRNTTIFPVSTLNLGGMTIPAGQPTESVLRRIINALEQQQRYNNTLKLALDDAVRSLHQRIDRNHGVGLLADRPSPNVNGMTYTTTDESPPTLYIAINNTWENWLSD